MAMLKYKIIFIKYLIEAKISESMQKIAYQKQNHSGYGRIRIHSHGIGLLKILTLSISMASTGPQGSLENVLLNSTNDLANLSLCPML